MTSKTMLAAGAAICALVGSNAWADDQPAPAAAPAAAAPAAPASWASSIKITGKLEGGITANSVTPAGQVNFGHLFTDRSDTLVLNQASLTIERDIDSSAKKIDWGFKLQGFYGSDARYTHFLGEFDSAPHARNQFDIVEANIQAHVPGVGKGGMDVKVGQFSTPLGVEVIDPAGNTFYSKSYIFNFGIPLKHTGILTTTHVNDKVDIYAGYDTGVNTSFGHNGGARSEEFHLIAGFGLNLKNVTVVALTHIGPELPDGALGVGVNVSGKYRYLTDANVTWKINSKLTSVTEVNYIHDDGANASGGGVAQYFTYPWTATVTAAVRVEVWRDAQGYYVYAFPGNTDFVRSEKGLSNTSYRPGVGTTYGTVTLGATWKPAGLPKKIDGLEVRPEFRWDRALAGPGPFGGPAMGRKGQFTFGIDLIVPIAFR